MANPTAGSWGILKKIARFILKRESVVWKFQWQDEVEFAHVFGDSDWGGNVKDRKSTSGGCWMVGVHLIKSWSVSQGAYALSSAEAELYAMVEAVTRVKGLLTLAHEMGFRGLSNVIHLGTRQNRAVGSKK